MARFVRHIRRPKPVGEVYRGLGQLCAQVESIRNLMQVWSGAVGPRLAEVSFPLRVQGQMLVVGVTDSMWIQELDLLAPQIVQRIADAQPDFFARKLRFEIVERGAHAAPEPQQREVPDLPRPQFSDRSLDAIADADLREAFLRLRSL